MKQVDRAIDWARDDTQTVLRKIHAADGFPGVRDTICGRRCTSSAPTRKGNVAFCGGAAAARSIPSRSATAPSSCATVDGAVWITHLRRVRRGEEPTLKLPAAQVLGDALAGVPEAPVAHRRAAVPEPPGARSATRSTAPSACCTSPSTMARWRTAQCRRLLEAIRHAQARPTKVLVLAGGPDFWSNGIHLNAIEATGQPADASWENINAIDDVAREIVTTTDRLTVSALAGNAGAGGVFLALAADRVWLREGVILNPHYKGMGNLYGSEYWTYLLPRRVGEARAQRDHGAAPADGLGARPSTLGLADARFGHAPETSCRVDRAGAGHGAGPGPCRCAARQARKRASATRPRSRSSATARRNSRA